MLDDACLERDESFKFGLVMVNQFVPKLVSYWGFSTVDFISMQNHLHYFKLN